MKTHRTLLLTGLACLVGAAVARANFTMSLSVSSAFNTITASNSSGQLVVRDINGNPVTVNSNASGIISPTGSPAGHTNPTYNTTPYNNLSLPDSINGQLISVGYMLPTGGRYSPLFTAHSGTVTLAFEALGLLTAVGDVTVRNPLGDTSTALTLQLDTYSGSTLTATDYFGYSFFKKTTEPNIGLPTVNQQFLGTTGQWRWSVQTNATPPVENPIMVLDSATGTLQLNGVNVATQSYATGNFLPIHPTNFSLGTSSGATGESFAGAYSTASGDYSFAISGGAATGEGAIAFGGTAAGALSFSISGDAYGEQSVAIGLANTSLDAIQAFALGNGSYAAGSYSVALGGTSNSTFGSRSIAIGNGNVANGFKQTVMGLNNLPSGNPLATSVADNDLIFMVGNGGGVHDQPNVFNSNALTIRLDAGTTIGTGLTSSAAAQVVLGKYNDTAVDGPNGPGDHSAGIFVVANGSSAVKKNAFRIKDDGTILMLQQGDLSMGIFMGGDKP